MTYDPTPPSLNNGDTVHLRYAKDQVGHIIGTLYLLGGSVQYLVNLPDQAEPKLHFESELEIHQAFDS